MPSIKATEEYNRDWLVNKVENPTGWTMQTDERQLVVLQEIRDELKKLNALMHCANTVGIPRELKGLRRDVKALTKQLVEKTSR